MEEQAKKILGKIKEIVSAMPKREIDYDDMDTWDMDFMQRKLDDEIFVIALTAYDGIGDALREKLIDAGTVKSFLDARYEGVMSGRMWIDATGWKIKTYYK